MKPWKQWRKENGFEAPSPWKRTITNAKYYKKHKSEIQAHRKAYREAHKKRINARRRKLYREKKLEPDYTFEELFYEELGL